MLSVLRRPLVRSIRSYSHGHSPNLRDAFEKHGVIHDVISCCPQSLLKMRFKSGVEPDCGNVLTPFQVKDIPCIEWRAYLNEFYFLCFIDPDAPSRKHPEFREWQHWLVGNIPGPSVKDGLTLQEFIPSAPPKGTGLHRYVFLVYKQPKRLSFDDIPRLTNRSAEGRGKFSLRTLVNKYRLGAPVAGNFYQAAYDNHVPSVYKSLGITM